MWLFLSTIANDVYYYLHVGIDIYETAVGCPRWDVRGRASVVGRPWSGVRGRASGPIQREAGQRCEKYANKKTNTLIL